MNPSHSAIKVIGVGGAGGNAVDRMMRVHLKGVELIALNTDLQDLKKVSAHRKLHIGRDVTHGLGAGMNPELGKKAALESKEDIAHLLEGAEMVFIAAGLGGGTGGGAIQVVADIAKSRGMLTIAVVTTPFAFEGSWRGRLAEKALEDLQGRVDTLLVISNDQMLRSLDADTTVAGAFWGADEVLRQAVQGISDVISLPGIINVDFADVKSIMKNAGQAVFGVGTAKGENRISQALDAALHSSLLTLSMKGAKGVLLNIAGSGDVSLHEAQTAAEKVKQETASGAKIIFGAVEDKHLKKGEVKITLIATGFRS